MITRPLPVSHGNPAPSRCGRAESHGSAHPVSARVVTWGLTVLVASVVSLWSSAAFAQTGAVTGRVTDTTGGVLPGVSVRLEPTTGGRTSQSTLTDERGAYRFDALDPGRAQVTFELINFSMARRDVTITAGGTVEANAQLTLAITADVVVTGTRTFRNIADLDNPAENLVGIAGAASQGAITAAQLQARPIMRPAEVLEAVPGLVVSQHSGEGKANQYYLRGFNLDHGSDFATMLAGVPVNMPSGAHFHGYSDTNLLIPELVSGVQFKKGPYSAEDGDFSAAGSANINYVNHLERPLVSLSGGGQGWGRMLAAASPTLGGTDVLLGLELAQNDGPWLRADDLHKVNGILRLTRGDARTGLSVTAMGYSADWNSTDQVARRAIDSGLISRFGNLNPTDGGRTYRHSVTLDGQRASSNASTRATVFVMRYGLNLISDFTYFLDDPENGDQFEQAERRWVGGGRVTHRRLGTVFGRHLESSAGVQLRRDAAGSVGFYKTVRSQRIATIRDDVVGQTFTGVFGQTEVQWARAFRTTLGLRGDLYAFDVRSSNPVNSGSGRAGLVSPKFTAVMGPWQGTELYANAGYGFHSNDARGVTLRVNPKTGEPVESSTPLVRAKGAELGVRTVRLRGLQSTAALWYLGFDSELLFIGDAGVAEASRPSRRMGIEWANYARLSPWMTAEADISFSRARFTDTSPDGDLIPGALDRVISGALTVEPARRLYGSVRLRHFGPRALIEDGSVSSKSTTIWNGEMGFRLTPHARVLVEGFNLLDSAVADIDYFYTSRLPGEPPEGVDDVHTHPSIPRTGRITLQLTF